MTGQLQKQYTGTVHEVYAHLHITQIVVFDDRCVIYYDSTMKN